MTQSNFELSTQKKAGPVECLGQTFPSEEARRAHYNELLREKLEDPEFRKIEGFPLGEDEDILNLSDPPFYTACPNPWIGDFIKAYGRPHDPKEKYHREPFAADVSEGKYHPIYKAHSYHTKVPHRAIMRYILHYTNPGDVVFDGFCGTGMTGVAAQLCGDEKEVQELGYRVDQDGTIYNEEGKAFSEIGVRRAVLNDLSPAATFIAYNYNTKIDIDSFEQETKRVLREIDKRCGWMYETEHTDGSTGKINYVVWSDVFTCPNCSSEIVFWESAVNKDTYEVLDCFKCPHCDEETSKKTLDRLWETVSDFNASTRKIAKSIPALIHYKVGKTTYVKSPSSSDLNRIRKIEALIESFSYPSNLLPPGDKMSDPKAVGVKYVFDFYTSRALACLSLFRDLCWASPIGRYLMFNLTSCAVVASKQYRFRSQGGSLGAGGGPMNGTLYVPSLCKEIPVPKLLGQHLKRTAETLFHGESSAFSLQVGSASEGDLIKNESLDYVFLDPPFGSNLMYSELNFVWESWLGIATNNKEEAIENRTQKKSNSDYRDIMIRCFRNAYLALKPGRWMTVEFSNTKAHVWNGIQTALQEAGFIVANVAALDKKQGSFNAVNNPTSVKQDLVISAYKPDSQLELSFKKHGDSLEGVWDFMLSHLKHLPVVKPRAGQLERIAERHPRILYDRMVAFYIGHNTPVPLSSGKFQAALADKFPERDGMVFLHEQVAEYDKMSAKMEHSGQMSIFVDDEKSAINWLRQFLKDKPSTYQGLHSEFMKQLSASWKKFESRPELAVLLDQNFIKYNSETDVPGQIHGYLSTDYKTLRKLEKDDPFLRAEAKDRWYVPDPKNAIDVEAQRDKRLLSEFWGYAEQAGVTRLKPGDPNQTQLPISETSKKKGKVKKLKEVRTEAIRVGFMLCNRNKDTATILAVAEILPQNVIEEDEQLQMIYDMAEMRAG